MLMVSAESPAPEIVNRTAPSTGCHVVLGSIVTPSLMLPTEGTGGIGALQSGGAVAVDTAGRAGADVGAPAGCEAGAAAGGDAGAGDGGNASVAAGWGAAPACGGVTAGACAPVGDAWMTDTTTRTIASRDTRRDAVMTISPSLAATLSCPPPAGQ